jgi:hypothetical protein
MSPPLNLFDDLPDISDVIPRQGVVESRFQLRVVQAGQRFDEHRMAFQARMSFNNFPISVKT